MRVVCVATEGPIDTSVARRICDEVDLEIAAVHGERGKGRLDRSLGGYNAAARHLNTDAGCAPYLRERLLAMPSPGMVRIGERRMVLSANSRISSPQDGRNEGVHLHISNDLRVSRTEIHAAPVCVRRARMARTAGRWVTLTGTLWSPVRRSTVRLPLLTDLVTWLVATQ